MIANYGYKDGSGEWFISIDTDKCNGCGECVKVCPQKVFEVTQDPNDPFRKEPVVVVGEQQRKKIKYTCVTCKPVTNCPPLPCITACKSQAITHSW